MSDLKYFIGFNLIPGIGRAKIIKLERYFGTLENAWHASQKELLAAGIDQRSVQSVIAQRSKISLDD